MKVLCLVVGLLPWRLSLTNGFQTVANPTRSSMSLTAVKDAEKVDAKQTEAPLEDSLEVALELPPVIQQIAEDRREYQMNLGKAMDTLRRDMPYILKKRPDFSIYDQDINLIDPSGVQLAGLDKYKSAFLFFQTFVGFWFAPSSNLQYRMVYDFCRSSIRVSWHAVLVPKVPLGRPLHVDGISYYELDRSSGKISEHRIEQLMINNSPVVPPYGMLNLLQQDALRIRGTVPAGVGAWSAGETVFQ